MLRLKRFPSFFIHDFHFFLLILSAIGFADSTYSGKLLLLNVHIINEDYWSMKIFLRMQNYHFSILIRCNGKNLTKLNYLFKEFLKFFC